MKTKILLLTLFVMAAICRVSAQKDYDIEHITVINLGDGRYLFRTHEKDDKDEKPLQGEHKIIDGYHSEYILAEFKDGLYHGRYQHFKNNKLKEEGAYREGRKVGVYTVYKGDGTIETQETFKEGKPDDMKKEYYSDGTLKSESLHRDGKKEGLWKEYYTDGKLAREKSYREGLEDGPERKYDYETGELTAELNYVKGKKDGRQRLRMISSQKNYHINSNYRNGELDGEYDETYEDNGVVSRKGVYKNGKEDGIWKYNSYDGVQKKELSYKNGKLDGECKYYFQDGVLEKIENYTDGKLEGLSKSYYPGNKRQVDSETNYTNGKKDGRYIRYDSNGKTSEEGVYDNGRLMSSKTYINGQLWRIQEFVNGTMITTEYDDKGNKKER